MSSGGPTTPTVAVGSTPLSLAVNRATDLLFVANQADNTVSVIDGATCNATITTGCARTPAPSRRRRSSVAVNQATGTVYVPNYLDSNMSVFGPGCARYLSTAFSPRGP